MGGVLETRTFTARLVHQHYNWSYECEYFRGDLISVHIAQWQEKTYVPTFMGCFQQRSLRRWRWVLSMRPLILFSVLYSLSLSTNDSIVWAPLLLHLQHKMHWLWTSWMLLVSFEHHLNGECDGAQKLSDTFNFKKKTNTSHPSYDLQSGYY